MRQNACVRLENARRWGAHTISRVNFKLMKLGTEDDSDLDHEYLVCQLLGARPLFVEDNDTPGEELTST